MAILIQFLRNRFGSRIRPLSRRRFLPLFAVIVVAACVPKAAGQGTTREYQIKAVLLFNLTQFVEWPESAFSSTNAPLVIGILGDDPFGKSLDDAVYGETVNNRPIVVVRYRDIDEVTNCQILFISQSKQRDFGNILSELRNRPIVTVADSEGFIAAGGMVRFFKNPENKIRIKINPDAVSAGNLSVSAKLLRVAEITGKEER